MLGTGGSLKILPYLRLGISSLLLCLLLTACNQNDGPIRIATHIWPGYEFLALGKTLDYIPDSVAELVDSRSATESLQQLHSGQADAAALTLDEVLLARSQGLDLRIILVMDISLGADQIIARSNIQQLRDLKGKTIAVEDTAVGRLLMMKAIHQAGLSLYDIDVMPVTIDEHIKLWQSGQADAIVTYEPAASSILQHGGHIVFDSSQVPETIVDVLAVKTETIQDHAEMLQTLVAGFFKSQKHFFTNPQDAAYRMSDRLNVPSQSVMSLYQGMELPSLERNRKLLSADNPQLLHVANDILSLKLFSESHSKHLTKQLYTDDFLP